MWEGKELFADEMGKVGRGSIVWSVFIVDTDLSVKGQNGKHLLEKAVVGPVR